ncbi:MAG: sigma-70 family RNA polymerase sigma factor [Planctomycetaceae bacterium]
MTSETRFRELIERIRGGDPASFEELVADFGDALRREVRFTLLDAQLRQIVSDSDICQSVVVRLLLGLKEGDFELHSPDDVLRLLKGIARNRVSELVRYWHTRKRDLNRNVSIDGNMPASLAATVSEPVETLVFNELVELVNHRLTKRDRQILMWRDQGLSWADIAAELGESGPDAVRKRHQRALDEIQEELTDDSGRSPAST